MPTDLLAIYLTDHAAGAAAGSRRMQRLAKAERASSDGPALAAVANEVEQDRQSLLTIVRAEGIRLRRYKMVLARAVEALGMVKTNGRLFHRSPLTTLIELEGMRMGVTGKLALWTTLQQTDMAGRHDLAPLIAGAERQLHTLRDVHERRAAEFAHGVR